MTFHSTATPKWPKVNHFACSRFESSANRKLKARYIVASQPAWTRKRFSATHFAFSQWQKRKQDTSRAWKIPSLKMELRWSIPLGKGYVFVIALNGLTDSVFVWFTDPSRDWLIFWGLLGWLEGWVIHSSNEQKNKGATEGIPHSSNWRSDVKKEEDDKRKWTH
jgi:hypothetical protein